MSTIRRIRWRSGRPSRARFQWGAVQLLIAANVAIFLIGQIPVGGVPLQLYLEQYGARQPAGSPDFHVWQLVTCMFLHMDIGHLFMNMLGLWWFGIELEHVWGWRKFLAFYFACGIGASIIDLVVLDFIVHAEDYYSLGASGAIFGVLTAFGLLFPRRQLRLWFFIPMQARTAVILFAIYELYAGVTQRDNVGHFAHLGGALVGFLLVRLGSNWFSRFQFSRPPQAQAGSADATDATGGQHVSRRATVAQVHTHNPAPFVMEHDGVTVDVSRERLDDLLARLENGAAYRDLSGEEKAIVAEAARRATSPAAQE